MNIRISRRVGACPLWRSGASTYADDEGSMRQDIYDEYRAKHPEEMIPLRNVYCYSAYVERKRAEARAQKVVRIAQYRRLFDGNDHTGR